VEVGFASIVIWGVEILLVSEGRAVNKFGLMGGKHNCYLGDAEKIILR
jgi:hypothetical protein